MCLACKDVWQAVSGRSARMEVSELKKELESVQSNLAYASKQLDSERSSGDFLLLCLT